MCSIVSLCEITHHGLHERKRKHGGGRSRSTLLCVARRDCVDSQIKAPAVCVCGGSGVGGVGGRDTDH